MIWVALFFLAAAVVLVIIDKLIEKSRQHKDDSKRMAVLAEQMNCPHTEKIQVGGFAWPYGIGILCKACGKELTDEEEKLYDRLFPERHEISKAEMEYERAIEKNRLSR